jgi:hypothetical protein
VKKLVHTILAVTFTTSLSTASAIGLENWQKQIETQQSVTKCTPYPDCALIIAQPTGPILQLLLQQQALEKEASKQLTTHKS